METKKQEGRLDKALLAQFVEFYEKQDIVQKQTTKSFIHEYGHSELHCIDAIGSAEYPNVTLIAQRLAITRGAASKITKRLAARGDITSFQLPGNKKEVYYALTDKGRAAFAAHRQRHLLWERRDEAFLQSIPQADKETVRRFLAGFNRYLQDKIEELDRDEGDNP